MNAGGSTVSTPPAPVPIPPVPYAVPAQLPSFTQYSSAPAWVEAVRSLKEKLREDDHETALFVIFDKSTGEFIEAGIIPAELDALGGYVSNEAIEAAVATAKRNHGDNITFGFFHTHPVESYYSAFDIYQSDPALRATIRKNKTLPSFPPSLADFDFLGDPNATPSEGRDFALKKNNEATRTWERLSIDKFGAAMAPDGIWSYRELTPDEWGGRIPTDEEITEAAWEYKTFKDETFFNPYSTPTQKDYETLIALARKAGIKLSFSSYENSVTNGPNTIRP